MSLTKVTYSMIESSSADSSYVGYLPAGTGAVATTVQAKLRDHDDQLLNIEGNLNFTTLGAATLPIGSVDLLILRQGAENKKVGVGEIIDASVDASVDASLAATAGAVTDAQAAALAAESARDAALIQAGVYVDEPTGRAAVADGEAFKVQGSGDVAAYEYRRVDAGSSTLIATYPSSAAVTALSDDVTVLERTAVITRASFESETTAWAVTDETGETALSVGVDGSTTVGNITFESYLTENMGGNYVFPVYDEANQIIFAIDLDRGQVVGNFEISALTPPSASLLATLQGLGARGNITSIQELNSGFYSYTSDALGTQLPFLRKQAAAATAHILNTSTELEVHISYGQSWRSMSFDGPRRYFGDYQGERVVTPYYATGAIGPIDTSAGINLAGTIGDICNFTDDEPFSIGRCAAVAFQRFREAHGIAMKPLLEYCHAYPGSSWTTGGDDALTQVQFFPDTGSAITFTAAQLVDPVYIAANPITTPDGDTVYITNFDPATGIMSHTLTPAVPVVGIEFSVDFVVEKNGGWTPTITNTYTYVSGPIASTLLLPVLEGLQVGGKPWYNGTVIIAAINDAVPAYGVSPAYRSVGWTQGGSGTYEQGLLDLAAMMAAYDAMTLPGTDVNPLNFYIGLPGGNNSAVALTVGQSAWLEVCRANANGRSWLTTPWYQWEYRQTDPADSIHTGPYGQVRHGEMEAYAKFCVEELGLSWNPLWLSTTVDPTVTGTVVDITFDTPPGPEFVGAELVLNTTDIEIAENYGFQVYVGGIKQTITAVTPNRVTNANVILTLSSSITPGASVEVSYCARDGVVQASGGHSGLWGNLMLRGAVSRMNPQWTLDAWACNFITTVTAS